MAQLEPFFVTIAAGLSMCLRALLDAKDSEGSFKGIEIIMAKCTENAGADLPLVRKAAIESNSGVNLVKLSKKVLDNGKAALAIHTLIKMLITPPPKGVTDVADGLRRGLIEGGFGQHVTETLAKYADNGPIVETAALNLQYAFNNPVTWDHLQPTVTAGVVAALAQALLKGSNHEGGTAASLESLAFIAHVDTAKRKGEWNVASRLANAEAWNTISNSLGKHNSGRVAAAAMLLLQKCAASPKAANFLRGMASAGLVTSALKYVKRSVTISQHSKSSNFNETSGSGRGRSASQGRTSANHRASSPMDADATLSGTGTMNGSSGGGELKLRSYQANAWAFVAELSARASEIIIAGEPENMVRILLEPLLNPIVLLQHSKLALKVLRSLIINSPDFVSQFVSHGGCSALVRLVDTLRVPDAQTCLLGADILLMLCENPDLVASVDSAGGFDVLVNAYFRAWEVAPRDMLENFEPKSFVKDKPEHNESLKKLKSIAEGIVKLSRDDDESGKREMLATVVANALTSQSAKSNVAERHVRAAACLVAWTLGAGGDHLPSELEDPTVLLDAKAYVHAGVLKSCYKAMHNFSLNDPVLGAVVIAVQLLLLVPHQPEEKESAAATLRPGDPPPPPPLAPGHALIGTILEVLKTSLKRTEQPDMAVWSSMMHILETTITSEPANTVCFLRWPGLLGLLSRYLEWGLRVCDAEQYRDWRLSTRPPQPDEEVGKKAGDDAKAAALAQHAEPAAAEEAKHEAYTLAMTPFEHPDEVPQWLVPRLVRLFCIACGENGSNINTVAAIRATGIHRKIADYVWPWTLALPGDGLSDEEVDNHETSTFLSLCWRVQKDGPYDEWEAGASREEILTIQKKFAPWKANKELLTEHGHGWKYAESLKSKNNN
jgi:hypothetical protein